MEKNYFLPAEWHPQSYIQLTWPHSGTDWNYMLDEVETCFFNLASEIASRQPLLLIAPEYPEKLKDFKYKDNIHFVKCLTNDTWARDHGFITLLQNDGTPLLLDFCFNGWGMKFAANYDNQINNELYFHHPVLKGEYVFCRNFILEGGSIESDGKGSLLTTEQCLLAKNRNEMNRQEVEDFLKETFNLKQVLWLKHGYLAGDDTDSHVDTLARFCPDDTIVYVKCTNEKDEHYKELAMMEEELKAFRTLDGKPYRLLPLPMASAVYGAILGVNSLIREESQGTIEFLYSKPINRLKIVTSKLCAIVAIFYVYILIIGTITMGVCYMVKPE